MVYEVVDEYSVPMSNCLVIPLPKYTMSLVNAAIAFGIAAELIAATKPWILLSGAAGTATSKLLIRIVSPVVSVGLAISLVITPYTLD